MQIKMNAVISNYSNEEADTLTFIQPYFYFIFILSLNKFKNIFIYM